MHRTADHPYPYERLFFTLVYAALMLEAGVLLTAGFVGIARGTADLTSLGLISGGLTAVALAWVTLGRVQR